MSLHLANNLSLHVAEADTPRVQSQHLLRELALKSMKHIPGSASLIEKHFNTDPIQPELKETKPINLVMHLTHHR
jgi:hypothetical protein